MTTTSPRSPFLHFLLGARSGRGDARVTRATIESVLSRGERPHDFSIVKDPRRLPKLAREAAERAAAQGDALVVVGGDGTISAVAAEALRAGCALGVIPGGTFNYFARAHGISEDVAEAARALLDARPRPVQVGLVNGRIFLVNASVGLYPEMLEEREQLKRRFGRRRIVALGAALVSLAGGHRELQLELDRDGVIERHRTPNLLVDNNRLQLERVGIDEADAVESGSLAGIMLGPVGTPGLIGVLVRGALGQLGEAEAVHTFAFRRLEVTPRRTSRRLKVGLDGEVARLRAPLVFEVSPRRLQLLLRDAARGSEGSAGPPEDPMGSAA